MQQTKELEPAAGDTEPGQPPQEATPVEVKAVEQVEPEHVEQVTT